MSRLLRSPIKWFGGKGNMVAKLLPYIPPHHTYVEPFGGGASLLMAKEPSPVEVYNDLDGGLVEFFRLLRDREKFERFHRLVSLTPYSREEYYYCRDNYADEEDEIKRVCMWFVAARQSFSGCFGGSWSYSRAASWRGMAETVSKWLSAIDMLPEISARLLRVQVEHKDALGVIDAYDTPKTFFYLDPPYLHSTRRAAKYQHEMTDDQHEALLTKIGNIKGKALLSGYPNDLYADMLESWQYKEFQTACHAAGRTRATDILGGGSAMKKQPRTECLWWNYELKDEAGTIDMFSEAAD